MPSALRRPGFASFHYILATGALLGVALVYAWPLVAAFRTHVPGQPGFADVTEYIWSVGWVEQVFTGRGSLFVTDRLLFPHTTDLRWGTFGWLQAIAAYPFIRVFGVPGAFNLVLLATLVLNGVVTYAFLWRLTRCRPAALIGAIWCQLATPILSQLVLGRSALGGFWLVALALLFADALLRQPGLGHSFRLAFTLIAAGFSDFQTLLFATLWLGLLAAYRLSTRQASRWRALRFLFLSVGGAFLGLGVVFGPTWLTVSRHYQSPSLDDIAAYAFSLRQLLSPGLWWYIAGLELLGASLATVLFFRRRREPYFWLAGAGIFLLLSLGPYLKPSRLPLPLALVNLLPALSHFRVPARFTIPALLGFAVASAYGLTALFSRLRRRQWILVVVMLTAGLRLVLAVAQMPFNVQRFATYQTYERLKAEPEDFTILELPFGLRSGFERIGHGGEVFQYYQHIHQKRLVGGSLARIPGPVIAAYREYPVLLFLAGEAFDSTAALSDDLSRVLDWSDTRYVLVHQDMYPEGLVAQVQPFLAGHERLRKVGQEADLAIYRVED